MSEMTRRAFLGTSAALAAGLRTAQARGDTKAVLPSEKVTVALVGCGRMGCNDLKSFIQLPDFQVAALCDIDRSQFAAALAVLKDGGRPTEKVAIEKDFRKVVERKDIDAVIVATPDHWHPYVLLAACANDKDVYCEKPLAHNIAEGRAMVRAARRTNRVVQIGTQQRSMPHFRDAVNYVRSGELGQVYLCRTWICKRESLDGAGNPPDSDPPPGVDYDLWLGPAPKRPFNKNRFHQRFRLFFDYGNGLCNDWGVHLNDIVLWAMNATTPLSVSAIGGKFDIHDNGDTPDNLDVYYEYPGFTHVFTVRRANNLVGFPTKHHGIQFVGTRAALTVDRSGWSVTPVGGQRAAEKHGKTEGHLDHVRNFLHCLRNRGEKPASEIEAMHHTTNTCHLANISYKVRRRVYWDGANERCYRGYDPAARKFVNEDSEANALLLREPRKPWSLSL